MIPKSLLKSLSLLLWMEIPRRRECITLVLMTLQGQMTEQGDRGAQDRDNYLWIIFVPSKAYHYVWPDLISFCQNFKISKLLCTKDSKAWAHHQVT